MTGEEGHEDSNCPFPANRLSLRKQDPLCETVVLTLLLQEWAKEKGVRSVTCRGV